jgi:hypothetical protein
MLFSLKFVGKEANGPRRYWNPGRYLSLIFTQTRSLSRSRFRRHDPLVGVMGLLLGFPAIRRVELDLKSLTVYAISPLAVDAFIFFASPTRFEIDELIIAAAEVAASNVNTDRVMIRIGYKRISYAVMNFCRELGWRPVGFDLHHFCEFFFEAVGGL